MYINVLELICIHPLQSIRLFLNKFNAWTTTTVFTYPVHSITVGGTIVSAPAALDGKQWIDVNRRSASLSFYGDSNADLWNWFEISKASVAHISRG